MAAEDGARSNRWRQGSVVAPTQAAQITGNHSIEFDPERDSLVVLSHDCDVTNADFSREPYAELLVARAVDRPDGSITYGKNPRRIQYDIVTSDRVTMVESDFNESFRVDREYLVSAEPDDSRFLSPETTSLLGTWAARRYRRSAFPDELNRRLAAAQKTIKEILRDDGAPITGVYLVVEDTELPEDVTYKVLLHATVSVSTYSREAMRLECQKVLDRIGAEMDSCDGIEVVDSELRSEGTTTIDDLRMLKRWDTHDNLSMRSVGDGDLSADV